MDFLKNTFLVRLFQKDKLLFGVIVIYMAGILYQVRWQREEFPFFLFGMYSLKEKPKDAYIAYSINVDGQEIKYSKLRDSQRELITSTIGNVAPLLEAGKMDTANANAFKWWLMKYCLDMRMAGDSKMDVFKLSCNYDTAGQIKILKKELIYSYVAK